MRPNCKTLAAKMQHRGRCPVGLIEIEYVFFRLPVVSYHAFVVNSRSITLVLNARLHVRKLPYRLCPQPWTVLERRPITLMASSLILFGVILARKIVLVGIKRVGMLAYAAAPTVL